VSFGPETYLDTVLHRYNKLSREPQCIQILRISLPIGKYQHNRGRLRTSNPPQVYPPKRTIVGEKKRFVHHRHHTLLGWFFQQPRTTRVVLFEFAESCYLGSQPLLATVVFSPSGTRIRVFTYTFALRHFSGHCTLIHLSFGYRSSFLESLKLESCYLGSQPLLATVVFSPSNFVVRVITYTPFPSHLFHYETGNRPG
jgi:hypothetical protein